MPAQPNAVSVEHAAECAVECAVPAATLRGVQDTSDAGANDETRALWEAHASWWQEEFTEGADAEYVEQIAPLALDLLAPYASILDIGTGEGQLARAMAAAPGRSRDRAIVGIDPVAAQVFEAARRGGLYARADAEHLPFETASFDAALACLVFEHIDGFEAALAEVARIIRPGGRFVFMLNHPLLQTPGSGWIDDHILDEQYWRVGPYLVETSVVEEVQKDVFIRFVHRPLHRYINAMADVGLHLTRMIEPAPPEGFLSKSASFRAAAAVPRLLVLVTQRSADL